MGSELVDKVGKIGDVLCDSSSPLPQRFRALFTLRNIGGEEAVLAISRAFSDSSALLKHELAYCLGQMQDERALPCLESVLRDVKQEPMVRHEAGEAIGAIGSPSSLPLLDEFSNDPVQEVRETCCLAASRIKDLERGGGGGGGRSEYDTVDPAPAEEAVLDTAGLTATLLDEAAPLFSRYKAMFALRNLNTPDSIDGLCQGLGCGSTLFRHEVAFVLGQAQSGRSVESLERVLRDSRENEMVRHEAAEALGAIATERCRDILREFAADPCRVVAESCVVALDMAHHEVSGQLQYANTATLV